MRKILITGAAGFIGSNFVRYLLQRHSDYQVIGLDALTYAGNLRNLSCDVWDNPQFLFIHGDINDQKLVENLIAQCDSVVHLAAETHVDNSIHDYNLDDFINTDVKGAQVLLDTIRHVEVERFLHVSSSEVYGTAEATPMSETHPLNPRSPYAGAKVAADRLAYAYHVTFGLPIVILRPFNNYGPRQHIEKLIPHVITQALQDQPISIHGDGSSARDWLYVEDHCTALDAALHAPIECIAGRPINIGAGNAVTVLDIARAILHELQKPQGLLDHMTDRPGQVQLHHADTRLARELLGWCATTDIYDGLSRTIAWFKSNSDQWKCLERKRLTLFGQSRYAAMRNGGSHRELSRAAVLANA